MASKLNRVLKLADELEPGVRRAFVQAIMNTREAVDVSALVAALEAGDVARAASLLEINPRLLFPLNDAIMGSYAAGAKMVTDAARRSGVVIGFDGRHPRAEAYARDQVGTMITQLAESQREGTIAAVRDVVENQLVDGRAPRSAALDIVGRVNRSTGFREGGIVGLDAQRADRLWKVTQGMRTPEGVQDLVQGGRVRYKVNRATERRILRAFDAGTSVPEADRVLSARQYGNQLLRERGETIARTESITALRAGRREGFEQAIEQGAVDRDAIQREWDASGDSRVREDHTAMDGATLDTMTEPWVLPDGSRMMYPGDGSMGAPADQVINCRCVEVYRVDWIKNA